MKSIHPGLVANARRTPRRLGPFRFVVVLGLAALSLRVVAAPDPIAGCTATNVHASVVDPFRIAFAPDGTLYVGRDNRGSGGSATDALMIHRVAAGGSVVTEFGDLAIPDPDCVAVDVRGIVSGTPGSILVGSRLGDPATNGLISAISPGGTVTPLFGPATTFLNPSDLVFDASGRLYFSDIEGNQVLSTAGGAPTALFDLPGARSLAVDALERLVVSSLNESVLRLYSTNGALLNATFATVQPGSPLAIGPGDSFWGNDVYAVGGAGELLRIAPDGGTKVVGMNFVELLNLAFGPDGALYVSYRDSDLILRIAPPSLSFPDMVTAVYAPVDNPATLSFAPDGTLFTGNAGPPNDPGASARIHRIGAGGSPVVPFGNSIPDPDAVAYDAAGIISGLPGSVLVGSSVNSTSGRITRITPDGTASTLVNSSTIARNPTKFVFAEPGLLYCSDASRGLFVMTNSTPVLLIPEANAFYHLEVDTLGRLLVSLLSTTDSDRVQLHEADGTLLNDRFVIAKRRTPLARGPGGIWGTGVYFVSTNGALMSVDVNGVTSQHGTGFGFFDDLAFGPDGALYGCDAESDCVLRIGEPVVAAPTLRIVRTAANTVVVSWPSPSTGWSLQQNTAVATSNWSVPLEMLGDNGTDKFIIVSPPTGTRFYRLFKP